MSASSRGPPPVATRLGGLTPRGPGGLTPGGVGGGSTPRPGGPTSLLKGDDDDEDSSSDDSDDDDDEVGVEQLISSQLICFSQF